MMTEEGAARTAESNFRSGYNCSQAVFCTFAPALGLDKSTAKRLSQPFGGGICRMRHVCGTVSGMLLALGLLEGSDDVADKAAKDSIYRHGQELSAQFKEQHGSIECRELLGLVPLGSADALLHKAALPAARPANSEKAGQSVVEGNATAPLSEARSEAYYKKRPCPELCASAAAIFARYLAARQ